MWEEISNHKIVASLELKTTKNQIQSLEKKNLVAGDGKLISTQIIHTIVI